MASGLSSDLKSRRSSLASRVRFKPTRDEANEFVRWIAGQDAKPRAADCELFRRAKICQVFPAYKLDELKTTPALEILRAIELLGIERDVQTAGG